MIAAYPGDDVAQAAWIDLIDPTPDEIDRVARATGLRVPSRDRISEIESSSRLAYDEAAPAYVVSSPLVAPVQESGPEEATAVSSGSVPHDVALTPVGFVVSSRVLVTVRFARVPAIDAVAAEIGAQPSISAEAAFLRILEVVVDRSADELERADLHCDRLSRAAFGDRAAEKTDLRATLKGIGRIAGHASQVRDSLLGLGRIAAFVTESGFKGSPPISPQRMKAIRADVASLTDYEAHLSGKAQFVLDATLGFINIDQNEIVKTLTIASVVGIPPVLVAGIYGMNFRVMPELHWSFGYPFALALMVASGLLPILWFKARGWM